MSCVVTKAIFLSTSCKEYNSMNASKMNLVFFKELSKVAKQKTWHTDPNNLFQGHTCTTKGCHTCDNLLIARLYSNSWLRSKILIWLRRANNLTNAGVPGLLENLKTSQWILKVWVQFLLVVSDVSTQFVIHPKLHANELRTVSLKPRNADPEMELTSGTSQVTWKTPEPFYVLYRKEMMDKNHEPSIWQKK